MPRPQQSEHCKFDSFIQRKLGGTLKLGIIPENLVERLALAFGFPPPGIMESWLGIMASRAVMTATKLDIFESLMDVCFARY